MQLPKKEIEKIIKGLLPLLAEGHETTQRAVKQFGATVISNGVTHDLKGKPIDPGKLYYFMEDVQTEVNHGRRLRQVIERAPTMAGMQEDLSRYLVKYGKSKQAITDAINKPKNTDNEN